MLRGGGGAAAARGPGGKSAVPHMEGDIPQTDRLKIGPIDDRIDLKEWLTAPDWRHAMPTQGTVASHEPGKRYGMSLLCSCWLFLTTAISQTSRQNTHSHPQSTQARSVRPSAPVATGRPWPDRPCWCGSDRAGNGSPTGTSSSRSPLARTHVEVTSSESIRTSSPPQGPRPGPAASHTQSRHQVVRRQAESAASRLGAVSTIYVPP